MPTAVQLDGESSLFAVEVDDVIAQRMLASEFHAELFATELPPQQRLGIRLLPTEFSGEGNVSESRTRSHTF
jgi:hypothetical protein